MNGEMIERPLHRKKKTMRAVTAYTGGTKYELIQSAIEEVGMVGIEDEDAVSHAYLVWFDSVVQIDRVQELKSYQRINHFPGMAEICRKDFLARNMSKMSRTRPDAYRFVPRTWILPSEYNLLVLHWKDLKKKQRRPKTFIMKPSNGAMGNGIYLFRNPERIAPHEQMIVQEYMDRPFLLDDYKIDLRLYALVTHCDPLRAFLYDDGLVRLGTEKYANPSNTNVDSLYMHLTNYSVNKHSKNFERDSDSGRGSKRSIKSLMKFLRAKGHDTTQLWKKIIDVVVKTLIVACPHILHSYRMCRPGQPPHSDSVCFEILGFDIFLDKKLNPWLLEVNRSPSFGTDENVDLDIKSGVVTGALRLLNIRSSDKSRNMAKQKADAQRRLFRTPNKHLTVTSGLSSSAKRKLVLNRRKEELKEKLQWARKQAAQEEYENENMSNYIRIFPSHDKHQQERYLELLQESFRLFHQNRSAPLQRNIIDQFRNQREDEILDLIEECEAEEKNETGKPTQRTNTLWSMPELIPSTPRTSTLYDDSETSKTVLPKRVRSASLGRSHDGLSITRPSTGRSIDSLKSKKTHHTENPRNTDVGEFENRAILRSRQGTTHHGRAANTNIQRFGVFETVHGSGDIIERKLHQSRISPIAATKETEAELYNRTLAILEKTRIKFPGKSDEEAEAILNNILEHWKIHKPHVASYWLIKLDTRKRQKIIDIVRGNVGAVVQKTWLSVDERGSKIMRTFSRLFNIMLANHGQGLWRCFTTSGNSWETMFSKSRDVLSETELNCCRRIVQLCKDCLLIVYKFACDAQRTSQSVTPQKRTPTKPESGDTERNSTKVDLLRNQYTIHQPMQSAPTNLVNYSRSISITGSDPKITSLTGKEDTNSNGLIVGNLPQRFWRTTLLGEHGQSQTVGQGKTLTRRGLLTSFQRSATAGLNA